MKTIPANKLGIALAGLLALTTAPSAHAISIQMVSVGNPGNPNDPSVIDTVTGLYDLGGVSYGYNIGKYEVTLLEYTAFLNAVAATDTYALYNTNMATNLNIAGISRSGSSGSYHYQVIGSGQHPVTYVNWLDSARFANWIANGQPAGAQGNSTTENGAYTLNGAMSGVGFARNTINSNTGSAALWYIPTSNEWYKAAYYSGSSNIYFDYPTQSNQGPGDTIGNAPGNTIGSDANQANYYTGAYFSTTDDPSYSSSQNYLTDVGAFSGSGSFYGTFDQGGNVSEWNDSIWSSRYIFRGGSWSDNWGYLTAGASFVNESSTHDSFLGFRLVSVGGVPEPSSALLMIGSGLMCLSQRRRTSSH